MNVSPKKSLGQHWLRDSKSLESVCAAAEIGPDDFVLEIGPGLGTLTAELVKKAKTVLAVEFDRKLAEQLIKSLPAPNLQVVESDILKFDFTQLPLNYKVAANIPYYLTSHLLRVLSETTNPPSRVALLVQKEVAERVCAEPGDMSMLSVSVQFYFETSLGQVVPAILFDPPPKVDSQILILKRRPKALFEVNEKDFFRLVKAGFSERRKKLRGSLSGGLRISKSEADILLEKSGVSSDLRAQNLDHEQWYKIYQAWTQI